VPSGDCARVIAYITQIINIRHSPGGRTTLQTPFSPVSFGKSFMKIRSAVPENGCLVFCVEKTGKTKDICKTSVKHIRIRLIGGSVNKTGRGMEKTRKQVHRITIPNPTFTGGLPQDASNWVWDTECKSSTSWLTGEVVCLLPAPRIDKLSVSADRLNVRPHVQCSAVSLFHVLQLLLPSHYALPVAAC